MRLCQVQSPASGEENITLTDDLTSALPPYGILSHTWSLNADEEVTLDNLSARRAFPSEIGNIGFEKLRFCAKQVRKEPYGLRHFWMDTCCINRANLVELSEAITSMWRWYRNSQCCWVYLADVSASNGEDNCMQQFRQSRWFTRGWTLQELLAPAKVEFFSCEGTKLGDKWSLEHIIHEITGIPVGALRGEDLRNFSVEERLRWTNGRQTKKVEDRAYCLLGIFDVSMSLRYGEGDKALTRLEAKVRGEPKVKLEVQPSSQQSDMSDRSEDTGFKRWLAPSMPDAIHAKVSAARHPDTGHAFTENLLHSWLDSDESHGSLIWINGKTGTGKTTLFSHIVDETRVFSARSPALPFAYHYCAFSDPDSQQPLDILGSFAVQLSEWQPKILEDLQHIYKRDSSRNSEKSLQISELETALSKHLTFFESAVLFLDALNESSDFTATLACINRLLRQLPNLMVLLTSTRSAITAGPERWPHIIEIQMKPDDDIQTVLESQLASDGPLGHLSPEAREKIRSTLSEDADQTFRWVALTLDNLRRQRTGKAVLKALAQMPSGLNATYAAMLRAIPANDRPIAREALMWLSFSLRPLSLRELSEAAVLEPDDTTLNQDSRLREPEVLLEICHGFMSHEPSAPASGNGNVRLAHSSVRDYLLSEHVRDSTHGDPFFALNVTEGNESLMQQCLTYLMFDDFTAGVAYDRKGVRMRHRQFPLLEYAANYWGLHASSFTTTSNDTWTTLAHQFFATRSLPRAGNYGAWVSVLIPDAHPTYAIQTQPLYYAASFGILPLVNALIASSPPIDLEAPGGRHRSTALQVATFRGRRAVSEALVSAGADFWSPDRGSGAPAWFWVHANGWSEMLETMMQKRPEIRENRLWEAAGDLKGHRRVVVRAGGVVDVELNPRPGVLERES